MELERLLVGIIPFMPIRGQSSQVEVGVEEEIKDI